MKQIIEDCERVEIEDDGNQAPKTINIIRNDGIFIKIEISKARLKGEWVEDIYHRTICNVCGGIRRDNRYDYIFFCNRCGADMRKGGAE